MRIKEVEARTGITSKNIRFYEKEGLLSPDRNAGNRYRQYTDEDVRRLKEIKLLRKLDVSLTDIKSIQSGHLALHDCLEACLSAFAEKKTELDQAIELCTQIQRKETTLQSLDADFYLNEIHTAEKAGARFKDIAKDFKNFLGEVHTNVFFEPDEPIMNQDDFVRELEAYALRKGKSLRFISMGMRPKILLDGTVYDCALEMPRKLHFPLSPFFAAGWNFGYRWVYLYEDKTYVW